MCKFSAKFGRVTWRALVELAWNDPIYQKKTEF